MGKRDTLSDWLDGCYDEDGNGVTCDCCFGDVVWNEGIYICKECGKVFLLD